MLKVSLHQDYLFIMRLYLRSSLLCASAYSRQCSDVVVFCTQRCDGFCCYQSSYIRKKAPNFTVKIFNLKLLMRMTGNSYCSAFLLKDATFFFMRGARVQFLQQNILSKNINCQNATCCYLLICKSQNHKKDVKMIVRIL